jgi:predicted nucleic acid-binding protein
MAILLLDTSVIIDVLNNKRNRAALLMELVRAKVTCSPVVPSISPRSTRVSGPKKKPLREELFASLQHLSITPPAARMAGEFKRDYARKGATLNLGDVIIAAVPIHNRLTLLKDNVKDFPMDDLSLYSLPKT